MNVKSYPQISTQGPKTKEWYEATIFNFDCGTINDWYLIWSVYFKICTIIVLNFWTINGWI